MTRGWVVALTALGALLASTSEADGQRPEHRRGPKAHVGIAFIAAEPVGELAAFFDQGFGAQLGVGIPIDDYGLFRIVGDLGLLVYGHERQSYCMSLPYGCRIGLDLTTTNNIAFGGLGPELALPLGVVEPYVRATRGFSYWFTNSWLSGYDDDDFGNTTHHSDVVGAWRAAAGVRLRITNGSSPVSLDFAVERHENGIADFLTEGDIVDHPDGSISIFPNRGEADLMTFRVGVSIGIPRDRH